jgi:Dolichyl-phosphate-mannose-protein mannosyltransferase
LSILQSPISLVSRFDKNDIPAAGLLSLLCLMLFISFRPHGEFPLNDDWAFILPVKWWMERGVLQFTDWQFMTLVGQVFLGVVVSSLTEFSITNLRLFVLGLAVVAVLSVYAIAKLLGCSRLFAVLAALSLLCNPIFLVTSASFMTDVPFLTVSLLAVTLFILGVEKKSARIVALSWLFVLLACLIRQIGLAVAIGFSVLSLSRSEFNPVKILTAVVPSLVIASVLAAFPVLVSNTIGLPSMYLVPVNELTNFIKGLAALKLGFLLLAGKNFLVALGYLGLCFVPLLAALDLRFGTLSKYRIWLRLVLLTVCLGLTFALYFIGRITPVDASTFFDFGLGVRNLETVYAPMKAPQLFWFILAFLGVLGCFGVLVTAYRCFPNLSFSPNKSARSGYLGMIFIIVFIYNLPFMALGGIWFDRYTLFNLAFFAPVVCVFACEQALSNVRRNLIYLSLIVCATFGVVGTHDYLEWNRQRWHGLSVLQTNYGLAVENIDGGFEFNNYAARLKGDVRRPINEVNISRKGAEYRVALSELPGHKVLQILPCNTFLYGSPKSVYLLKKVPF